MLAYFMYVIIIVRVHIANNVGSTQVNIEST